MARVPVAIVFSASLRVVFFIFRNQLLCESGAFFSTIQLIYTS
jgi:hypothetical protein